MLFLDALQENKGFNCRFKCFHVNFGQCDFEREKKMHKTNALMFGIVFRNITAEPERTHTFFRKFIPFFIRKKYNFSFGAFFHLWPYLTFFGLKVQNEILRKFHNEYWCL